MTGWVRGWLSGLAALAAIGVLCPSEAWACLTDFGCILAGPDTPICVNLQCVGCTSSSQCNGLPHAGPNCELADAGAQGSCFDCTKEGPGQACPASTPSCDLANGFCTGEGPMDSGAPDVDASTPPTDSGTSSAPEAGDAAADAGGDAPSTTDATLSSADGSATDASDYGNVGLIEGGACSCDLPGGAGAGLGAGGLALAMGLLLLGYRRGSTR